MHLAPRATRRIAILACAGVRAAAGACYGVSPTGVRWVYVQPQHTGTVTVWAYLRHMLSVATTCVHAHEMVPPAAAADATFAFSFVANPFRRMLSHAGFEGTIGRQRQHNTSRAQDVRAFRKYVRDELDYRGRPHPNGIQLYGQHEMLANYPTRFVGCTSRLAADLRAVLLLLGYRRYAEHEVAFAQSHCASSCGRPGGGVELAASEWYDAEAERRVRLWMRADFAAFNFSTAASAMFDVASCERRDPTDGGWRGAGRARAK